LTGLFNHSTIKKRLDTAIAESKFNENDVCFAMIDVDGFRKVNDSYGNPTGDRVLITLASFLRQRLRKTDIIGRYGGNEYAAILPQCPIDTAVQLIDQLRDSFAAIRFPAGDDSFSSTFSCGVAPLSRFGDAEQLCKAADAALYKAKNSGCNRVVVADGVKK
jgi:diguanylate cyclase (GGDEF)-like protein